MTGILLLTALVAAPPSDSELQLLKVFRSEFVAIAPGQAAFPAKFSMGSDAGNPSERPVHEVTLIRPFEVARYEVPQNLWQVVMGANPSRWKGPRNSVEMLSYEEAREFCRRITERLREAKLIDANEVVRLPSEAEWEYVARAGTRTTYSFGDNTEKLSEYAWFTGNAAGNDPPVGAKKPNSWGLYDIHGYLWEWCADDAHDSYDQAPGNGSPWNDATPNSRGVLRGGSWKDPAEKLTSSFRQLVPKSLRDDAVGLRCVLGREN